MLMLHTFEIVLGKLLQVRVHGVNQSGECSCSCPEIRRAHGDVERLAWHEGEHADEGKGCDLERSVC